MRTCNGLPTSKAPRDIDPKLAAPSSPCGGFHKWVNPTSWRVYFMENPIYINGWFGDTLILGNPHVVFSFPPALHRVSLGYVSCQFPRFFWRCDASSGPCWPMGLYPRASVSHTGILKIHENNIFIQSRTLEIIYDHGQLVSTVYISIVIPMALTNNVIPYPAMEETLACASSHLHGWIPVVLDPQH